MPYLQNISDEKQLIRIQGEKRSLNPGEIVLVSPTEASIVKTYQKLFQLVEKEEKQADTESSDDLSIEKMSKKQFKEYALTLGIELDESKKRTEMDQDFALALEAREQEEKSHDEKQDTTDDNTPLTPGDEKQGDEANQPQAGSTPSQS